MPRKKRDTSAKTPLSNFLNKLLKEKDLTTKELGAIAGVAPSVVQGWKDGAMPSENVSSLKKLCNHFGYSLSYALTGTTDDIQNDDPLKNYVEDDFFEGYAKIKITKLIPAGKLKKI